MISSYMKTLYKNSVITDRELRFAKHVKYIYKSAGNKLNTLTRIANILNTFQENTFDKSFIKGQFNYCLLLWMFSSRLSNNFTNKIHKGALSLTTEIIDKSFKIFSLSTNNKVSLKNKNIQALLIEVYQNLNGLS